MGADFCFADLPDCNMTDERADALRAAITTISDGDLDSLIEGTAIDCDYETLPMQFAAARKRYAEAIETVITLMTRRTQVFSDGSTIIHRGSRETMSTQQKGSDYCIMVTGGMSHGDPPTECFDDMVAVSYSDTLFDLLLKWSREDCKLNA